MPHLPELVVIAADGKETIFTGDSQVHMDHNNLLLLVKTAQTLMGWHWDRFACVIIRLNSVCDQEPENTCEAKLHLSQGQKERHLSFSYKNFHLSLAENLLRFEGQREQVIFNLDFLYWYQTKTA